jgi:hypothetical protein
MRDLDLGYSRGVPVKNPLTTDPVRQQFAWKQLAIEQFKNGQWPLWNPYNFSGTPLLANFQTAAFYPLNILFFAPNILNYSDMHWFSIQWSWYIYLQLYLSFLFMYVYLRKIGLVEIASAFGALVWAFCGFNLAWWEWGNVGHTILYFPIILYYLEKIIEKDSVVVKENHAYPISLLKTFFTIDRDRLFLILALASSFLAGHFQSFMLLAINVVFYVLYKIPLISVVGLKIKNEISHRRLFYWTQLVQVGILFLMLVSLQSLPTSDFANQSARNVDTTAWTRKDWFYPWEHFATLIAPDFFGNPTTNNYWGVWNYGEFASYIGIIPLLLATSIVIMYLSDQLRKFVPVLSLKLGHKQVGKETLDIIESNTGVGFFLFAVFVNLTIITRNPFTELLYSLHIPFLTASQPSRGIAVVDFALSILAAVAFHKIVQSIKDKTSPIDFASIKTNINFSYILVSSLGALLWYSVITQQRWFTGVSDQEPDFNIFNVSRSNLIIPTGLFVLAFIILRTYFKTLEKDYIESSSIESKVTEASTEDQNEIKNRKLHKIGIYLLFLITVLDLGRFFLKFQSFSDPKYLYPEVSVINQIKDNPNSRYMVEDSRLLAPNLNIPYKVQTVEGYDPLYLEDYGKFIGLWQRGEPNLSPFPANRILTPHTPKSVLADISATNYLLSFGEYTKYQQEGQIGQTKLYLRDTALPRATILPALRGFKNEQEMADFLFSIEYNPYQEGLILIKPNSNIQIPPEGTPAILGSQDNLVEIAEYTPNQITIQATLNDAPGLLYLADTYTSDWKAYVNGKQEPILKTNFTFRGVQLSPGTHTVVMRYEPKSFTTGLGITSLAIGLIITLSIVNLRKNK